MELKREHQINFLYIVAAIMGVTLIQTWLYEPKHVKEIPYSEFRQLASEGKLADVVIRQTSITGMLKDAKEGEPKHFSTNKVDPALASELAKDKLTFSGEPGPGLARVRAA